MDQLLWGSRWTGFQVPRLVRQAVFVEEQGFALEFDRQDDTALHLSLLRDGQPAGCARLFREAGDVFHLGRVAVLPAFRNQGLGRLLVEEAARKAARLGCRRLVLSAQCHALGFYDRLGYRPQGEPFLDEHCPHQEMAKELETDLPLVRWHLPGEGCPAALALRRQVFAGELGVPVEEDPLDSRSHLLLLAQDGQALATARLTPQEDGVVKFSRLAVDPRCRGKGLGALLLENLSFRAMELGYRRGWLSARAAVLPFYEKAGFLPQGEPYWEEGEPHQAVWTRL